MGPSPGSGGGPVADSGDNDGVQREVFALMTDPATHGGEAVTRVDTHSAVVFIAGDLVFKVKRALRYPFLDFSTLGKRKAACEAEVTVNRAFAPALYLGVVAVTRGRDGRLRLGGDGEAVEWAVRMRRFDERSTLDHLAASGRIDRDLAVRLAVAVADTHRRAAVLPGDAWIAALPDWIAQNEAAFRADAALFDPAAVTALARGLREALGRLRPLLVARGAAGMIRRGHGDLHLGNVALIDGAPVLFDAIEFDEVIAAGDVLYDLAFLLMDLVERRLVGAANAVLNGYLAATRHPSDLEVLAALPLFMALRAAIRASVTASRAELAEGPGRDAARRNAREYFQAAYALIAPSPPVLVGIGGLSGTGKSALALALAPALAPASGPFPGALVLRSDVERKALAGRREDERLPPEAYDRDSSARVHAVLADMAGRALAAGHAVVVDAVHARPGEREALRELAARRGVAFHGLFLEADLATRAARVASRLGDASDASEAVVRAQESYALGANDWTAIDASGTPQTTLARACAALERAGVRTAAGA